MNDYLAESIACLSVGVLVFILGRMRLVHNTLYIPLCLSSFIFIGLYGVTVWHEFVIPRIGLNDKLNRLLFYDYGNELLGLLPLAFALLLIGKRLLEMDYNEQWST